MRCPNEGLSPNPLWRISEKEQWGFLLAAGPDEISRFTELLRSKRLREAVDLILARRDPPQCLCASGWWCTKTLTIREAISTGSERSCSERCRQGPFR